MTSLGKGRNSYKLNGILGKGLHLGSPSKYMCVYETRRLTCSRRMLPWKWRIFLRQPPYDVDPHDVMETLWHHHDITNPMSQIQGSGKSKKKK